MNLNKLVKNLNKIRKSNNVINCVPRQTLIVEIDGLKYYICLICNEDWQVQVVLLDSNKKVVYKILELYSDRGLITKLQNCLYVFTESNAYIYDINNLNLGPYKKFLGDLDFQSISANDKNIFAYSTREDKIIKYEKDLVPVGEYENPYSNDETRVSLNLACNQETFFCIPIMALEEEKYLLMKNFIRQYIGISASELNCQIHSCSFNVCENTLYIAMYNLIWIIKDETEFSYLYFKDEAITNIEYDNDLKELIINFGSIKGNHLSGSIVELSFDEIMKKSMSLDKMPTTFDYSKSAIDFSQKLLPAKNMIYTKK